MIVDTSAIIAIIDDEVGAAEVIARLDRDPAPKISAATLVELTAVLQRYQQVGMHARVRRLLDTWGVATIPFDEQQAEIAQRAYRDYGRGSGSPAKLNIGDCYSYALATVMREPLLYVGDDFAHTDLG